jgi:hypothetical protein
MENLQVAMREVVDGAILKGPAETITQIGQNSKSPQYLSLLVMTQGAQAEDAMTKLNLMAVEEEEDEA